MQRLNNVELCHRRSPPRFMMRLTMLLLFLRFSIDNLPTEKMGQKEQSSKDYHGEPLCFNWDTDIDSWWTHKPTWCISKENDTHVCFLETEDKAKARFLRRLHDVQFNGNCSNVTTQFLNGAGWGAVFKLVNDGLAFAWENDNPVQMHFNRGSWRYAVKDDGSNPACPQKDMSCYFQPIGSCAADPNSAVKHRPKMKTNIHRNDGTKAGKWLYEYATRPQAWLRREIFNLTSKARLSSPCTVFHVRRNDVEMDGRKYHPIKEYVDEAKKRGKKLDEIFIATDDQNAVEEAESEYPQYSWRYLDRPRFRGSAGWQSHMPADSPKDDVVALLSVFELAARCDTFVHGRSRFASLIKANMPNATHIHLDDGFNN